MGCQLGSGFWAVVPAINGGEGLDFSYPILNKWLPGLVNASDPIHCDLRVSKAQIYLLLQAFSHYCDQSQ